MTTALAVTQLDADHAKLPRFYEEGKASIAASDRIDECKEWADRAAALASYARQAQDQELYNCVLRIRARAVRRMGELLAELRVDRERNSLGGFAPTEGNQRDVAAACGISKDQEVSARRLASIPSDDFERIMESAAPPSITTLADMNREIDRAGRVDPKSFVKTTSIVGVLHAFLSEIKRSTPEQYCEGVVPYEIEPEIARLEELKERSVAWFSSAIQILVLQRELQEVSSES